MSRETEQLQNEIRELKRELDTLKKDMSDKIRQEIIAQQQNSRDVFRSDRGKIILKKNSELQTRKSIVPQYDNVTSLYFNNTARKGVNVLYLGHDGGNDQRYTNEIAVVAAHNTQKLFDVADTYSNGSIYLKIEDTVDGEREITEGAEGMGFLMVKNKYLYQSETVDGHSSFLMARGTNGIAGIGTNVGTDIFFPVSSVNNEPTFNIYNGKGLKVNVWNSTNTAITSTVSGTTGTFSTPTSITVRNGIVTSVTGS